MGTLSQMMTNARQYGSFWRPIERTRDWIFGFSWLAFRWEQRPKTAFMGRFGGGWQVKLGIQFSRFSYILVSLWFGTLTIASGGEAQRLFERKKMQAVKETKA